MLRPLTCCLLFLFCLTPSLCQPDAARDAEARVTQGLPDTLPSSTLDGLPIDVTPVPEGVLVVPKPFLPTPATDPAQGQSFSKITYLYTGTDALSVFCRVRYTDTSDAPLAARMARLLRLLSQTLHDKTGWEADGSDTPFDVWLCRAGKPGGEQFGRNIFFYELDAPRSSIEWVREIAHEFSHLALPPIGGYTDPEYWASGYLGERLLVRWLERTPGGAARVEATWGNFSGAANFNRLLIAPALALYAKIGPSPKWLARTDADGMRYLIGQALTVDDKYGARALGEAFAALPRARPATAADLAEAFGQAAAARKTARHSP